MANAHFGLGDKSKWGYLGSRKAVYDEWRGGKSISKLAATFDRTPSQIKELILEYILYLKALGLNWTKQEKNILLEPSVEFNPPVRFLQTGGHKKKMGIALDAGNLKVVFSGGEAKKKFKHLIKKLVISPRKGLGATATFEEVFADYKGPLSDKNISQPSSGTKDQSTSSGTAASASSKESSAQAAPAKPGALFNYPVTIINALISQLMREAKEINAKKFPAASTFLLRNIVEAILKHIIDQQKANPASKTLDLEGCINLCISQSVSLGTTDKKILKEFNKSHVSYLNLGAHGNVVPNFDRLSSARDCIDQFIKRNV